LFGPAAAECESYLVDVEILRAIGNSARPNKSQSRSILVIELLFYNQILQATDC
jgi:hypothetical protein